MATGHIDKRRYTLTLPAGRTNDFVTEGMVETIAAMKGSRYADIIIRKDGADHRFQADWLRYVTVRREPRFLSLLDTIPRALRLWWVGRQPRVEADGANSAAPEQPPHPQQ
jgi:hypothetical protein